MANGLGRQRPSPAARQKKKKLLAVARSSCREPGPARGWLDPQLAARQVPCYGRPGLIHGDPTHSLAAPRPRSPSRRRRTAQPCCHFLFS